MLVFRRQSKSLFFSPNEQRAGGRGRCQTFSFSYFPCSTDHERDWPPCIFGLATNALNVSFSLNNNNNKSLQVINVKDSKFTVPYVN